MNTSLREKIANHPFKTMREEAVRTSAKINWYLGESGADELMSLIEAHTAEAVREAETTARVDELTTLDNAGFLDNSDKFHTYYIDRIAHLTQSTKEETPNEQL